MSLSKLDSGLWVAGFISHAALLAVLFYRGRWREYPVFTTFIAFHFSLSPVLYVIYGYGTATWYSRVYWSSALLDFGLQLGVVFEVARIVLRPTGTWVQDARKHFLLSGTVGILAAAALAWMVTPPVADALDRWELQGNLFTAFVICELFLIISATATRFGLGWRSHIMAIEQGFAGWVVVAVLVETLHSYFGTAHYFFVLEYAKMFVYLAALGYWIARLWLEEPARQPLSPELREYILALHRQVQYDLGRVDIES